MGFARVTNVFSLLTLFLAAPALAQVTGRQPAPVPQGDRTLAMCADCHATADPAKDAALKHGDVGTCLACHHIGFTNDPRTAETRRLQACIDCHDDVDTSHFAADPVDAPACTGCHTIHGDTARAAVDRATSSACASCHTPTHTLHSSAPAGDAPVCTQCHVTHGPSSFAAEDRSVMTDRCSACHESSHPAHAAAAADLRCVDCHTEAEPAGAGDLKVRSEACRACHTDELPAHAPAGVEAPVCLQCHTFGSDRPIEESLREMSVLCGECHTGEWDKVRAGGHRDALARNPNEDLPTCLTCHAGHIDPAEAYGFTRLAATRKCIECHSRPELIERYGLPENVGPSYADDYHGTTAQFLLIHPAGEVQPAVMVCADCHGAHEVGWADPALVADVCASCHENGDQRLAGAWLGHDPIGPQNQTLVWLVRIFYYGLIPFMLGGLFLTIAFDLINRRRRGARILKTAGMRRLLARIRGQKPPELETVARFSGIERMEHFGAMTTFFLLVATGLPQTRPDLGISNAIIGFFGGIASTRMVHRATGFFFVALLIVHASRAVVRAMRTRRMPIMIPNHKDFENVLQTFRHFLFRERMPRVGKFDFWEKFEYWGLFLGGLIIGLTGLILIWPEVITRFLPGQIVAASRVVHGLEATFAVLVIVLWHSYGVILRPEIFPLDTSIFTGKVSLERLKEEHPLEYERLFPDRAATPERPAGDDEAGPPPATPESGRIE